MLAVLLVGGEGTRLRPLTYATPKQMLPIVDVPMIVRVLEGLARFGVDRAVLSLGYRPDAFTEAFPTSAAAGVKLEYAVEPEPLDTAGAVRFAADAAGVDETFVVVNGDVLTDLDVTALVALHRERAAEGTIALTPVANPSAFGIVGTDGADRVVVFVEKPAPGTEPGNLANAGTYVLEPSVLGRIPTGRRVSIERETFPAMVADGSLYALASDAYWIDTGTPAQYVAAQLDIVAGRRPGIAPPGTSEIEPGVHVAPGAVVEGVLVAPCYVGAGAHVAAGATVSGSIVSAGASVGREAVVAASVLLSGATVGEHCRVEDSVVGPGAVVGLGSVVRAGTVVGPGHHVPPSASLEEARVPATSPS
jgi:mannose-1-phosphate guanylyltransferase